MPTGVRYVRLGDFGMLGWGWKDQPSFFSSDQRGHRTFLCKKKGGERLYKNYEMNHSKRDQPPTKNDCLKVNTVCMAATLNQQSIKKKEVKMNPGLAGFITVLKQPGFCLAQRPRVAFISTLVHDVRVSMQARQLRDISRIFSR